MIKITESQKKKSENTYSPEQMMNGVFNTLFKRGFKQKQSEKVVYQYMEHIGGNIEASMQDMCVEIQKDFDNFIRWVREINPEEEEIYTLKGEGKESF